jgi:16S rRNA (guanine527-N7)-methyltransferase
VTTREFQDRIARRARRAGVSLAGEVGAGLETYFRLLAAWNSKINLTGLDLVDPSPETLDRLLIEPLVAARHAPPGARTMIDIGSGGGSPALPFALAYPGISLLMVESKTRKSVFLREAVRALGLPSAAVATQRFEELLARPDLHERHDLLTIRAVRVESRVLMSLQAFVRPNGHLLLFRGTSVADPSEAVHPPLSWKATFPLIEAQRSRLVVLEKRTIGR